MKTTNKNKSVAAWSLAVSLALPLLVTSSFAQNGGHPSAKATAKTANVVLIPETTGTGDWVSVLTNTIKTPNMKDLFVTAALEVGLYTRTETPPNSLARASVQVRVLRDGQVVEPGIIAYNRRIQTLNSGEPIELILDTLEASSFSFVDVDVPVGVHTITVQVRVDTGGSGDFTAFGLVGKGTLTVEAVRMIKGEDVVLLQ